MCHNLPTEKNYDASQGKHLDIQELLRERLGKSNEVVLDEYLKLLRRNYIEESKHVFVRGMQFSARFLVKTLFDEDNKPHFDNKGLHNSMKPEE